MQKRQKKNNYDKCRLKKKWMKRYKGYEFRRNKKKRMQKIKLHRKLKPLDLSKKLHKLNLAKNKQMKLPLKKRSVLKKKPKNRLMRLH